MATIFKILGIDMTS